jgi:restriction system protein
MTKISVPGAFTMGPSVKLVHVRMFLTSKNPCVSCVHINFSKMIPDFQSIMLPLLRKVQDGKEYKVSNLIETLASDFNLSEEDRSTLLPSGTDFTFNNRSQWAKTYLKKAGLLDSPRRAYIQITPRGKEMLASNPPNINIAALKKFPEFVEFHTVKKGDQVGEVAEVITAASDKTPEEQLAESYEKIRSSLAQEIIEKVITLSPQFFERLVVKLIVKMGYGGSIQDAGKSIGKTGDEGIDGVIKEDRLGLDIIYLQAKRWNRNNVIGRPEIQRFVGALAGQGAKKGVFITTSSFTKEAREYAPKNETKIVLLDGDQLAQLMIDFDLGVSTHDVYAVKKLDFDFFEDE